MHSTLSRLIPSRHYFPLLAFLAIATAARPVTSAHGDVTTIVSGYVLDLRQAPIAGAAITVAGRGERAISGADGRYLLSLTHPSEGDEVTLAVRRAGFEPLAMRLRLQGGRIERNLVLTASGATDAAAEQRAEGRGKAAVGAPATAGTVLHDVPAAAPILGNIGGRSDVGRAKLRAPMSATAGGAYAGHWPHRRVRVDSSGNTEAYDRIEENAFRSPRVAPLSTFSVDVDRASYGNVRRYLTNGSLPPQDAVRIEELVNYFPYDDPAPRAGDPPLRITTEIAPAPWNERHDLVRVALRARDVDMRRAPASNLVFLIDVSGSMAGPNRLPLVKQSLAMLVNQLREQDFVSIVVYAGSAGLVLPATSGADRHRILSALDRLEAGGSTAGGAGLRLAYDVARDNFITGGTNRVIICTDGDFNVGQSSDAELVRLIENRRKEGAYLTILGFGMGNYKDSKMEKLAGAGNGNYAYVDDLLEARKMLVKEMGGTLVTVAKDVKLQVELNPERVQAYRLLGYEDRLLRDEDFANDAKDAGDVGAGHTVTALYEIVPTGVPLDVSLPGVAPLRYQAPPDRERYASDELLHVAMRYKAPDGDRSELVTHPVMARHRGRPSESMRFASAVAGFGMLLRQSPNAGSLTWDQVIALARGARGEDEEGYRADFVRLAETAWRLSRPRDRAER